MNDRQSEELVTLSLLARKCEQEERCIKDEDTGHFLVAQLNEENIEALVVAVQLDEQNVVTETVDSSLFANELIEYEKIEFLELVIEELYSRFEDEKMEELWDYFYDVQDFGNHEMMLEALIQKEFFQKALKEWERLKEQKTAQSYHIQIEDYDFEISKEEYAENCLMQTIDRLWEAICKMQGRFQDFQIKEIVLFTHLGMWEQVERELNERSNVKISVHSEKTALAAEGEALQEAMNRGDTGHVLYPDTLLKQKAEQYYVLCLGKEYLIMERKIDGNCMSYAISVDISNSLLSAIEVSLVLQKGTNEREEIIKRKLCFPFMNYKDRLDMEAKMGFTNQIQLLVKQVSTQDTIMIDSLTDSENY